ncbi:MAG: cell division protein FtsI (penicillin-binding protein 3) [Lentisphaeria bacterium]
MNSKKNRPLAVLPSQSLSMWRLSLAAGVLAVFPFLLTWHLAHLQVVPGEERGFHFLQNEGEARTLRNLKINAYRGTITDRNGELLAVSTPVKSLFVNPKEIKSTDVARLARALKVDVKGLRLRLAKYKNKQFMYLARHLPPHEADAILAEKITGLFAQEEYRRFYPAGEVVAHVVGFTDVDDTGQEGAELAFDHWLAGAPGEKKVIKDLKGNVVKELGVLTSPNPGNDLKLTIDMRLQYLAYRELKNAIAKQGAKSGSLVMMDAQSGEILAMANQPSYNPNDRSTVIPMQLRNRAFTDVFEPGSTMKPFTIMAALETGDYTPAYTIDTSPGHLFVAGKMIPDPVNYGVMDLTKIIIKSSQVGISKLALKMEPEIIRDMYLRTGLGQTSGSGFPGESAGYLPSHEKWHPIEQVTFAYGYGLSVNAVQLAQAYSVIASGGKFNAARLIYQNEDTSQQSHQIIAPHITQQITKMLKQVVEPGGTATRAQIDAYPVAGKTGTAHKVGAHGYADDKYMALFAGFSPADKPEIVAVVVINEPPSGGGYSGGKAAAPVFASAVEEALRILHVPPVQKAAVASIQFPLSATKVN